MEILLIDNNDSFTYNLSQLIEEAGFNPVICKDIFFERNSFEITDYVNNFNNIIFSPGSGLPSERKGMKFILENFHNKNILGICLGHQQIAEHFNSALQNHNLPQHGIKSKINHFNNSKLFIDIPEQFHVGRYHSWFVREDSLSKDLEITCRSNDNIIMGIKHKFLKIEGIQFHPESYLSEFGIKIIHNFMT